MRTRNSLRSVGVFGWVSLSTALAFMLGASPGPAPIRFRTNFEGGSLGTIEVLADGTIRCHVRGQQDEHGRNRQATWYYFRMDGVKDREVNLILTDFVGEYNGKPGACPMGPNIVPVMSEDGEHWRHVPDSTWNGELKETTLRLRTQSDSLWIAHQQPYTPTRLRRLLEDVDQGDNARIEVIGKTVQGRDLVLVTVTDPSTDDREKLNLWLQARQHAWESGTSYVMEGAIRFINSDDPDAIELRRRAVFHFLPMGDPDGSANGQVRFNANGFDVNRHWDEVDLRRKRYLTEMPEIWYAKRTLLSQVDSGRRIDLMLNLHNTETGEYLQTQASDDASRAIVKRLSDRLIGETSFRPSHGPVLGSGRDSTANHLNAEKGILVVLMEQRIGKDPDSGRLPNASDRLRFGGQLIRIMASSVHP